MKAKQQCVQNTGLFLSHRNSSINRIGHCLCNQSILDDAYPPDIKYHFLINIVKSTDLNVFSKNRRIVRMNLSFIYYPSSRN